MASKAIGFLNFKFGADLKGFDRAMKKAQKNLKKFGKNIQKTGRNLTTGLTLPIVALGAASIKAFDAQEKAIAQVEAGLKSTGNTVGFTSEKLQQMASDLQKTTLFGDEEILKGATAQLLTFTNITGEQFAKTQEIALDLATRLDGDLKSASIMLGKALNDPVANLSALSRAGIQFSKEQKETIKSLVETNQLAEAQTIILAELEKQYGGSAEAAAKAGMGPIKQLQNQLSDLSEQIGARLIPYVQSFVGWITQLAEKFDRLSESQKDSIVKWGLIIAAIGPVLIVIGKIAVGVSALIPVFKAVGALIMRTLIPAFQRLFIVMMANPILATIGLLTALGAALFSYTSSSEKAKIAAKKQADEEKRLNWELREKEKNLRKIAAIDYEAEVTELKIRGASEEEIKLKAVNFQLNSITEQLKKIATAGEEAPDFLLRQRNYLLEQRVELEKKIERANRRKIKSTQQITEKTKETKEEAEKYTRALDPLIENINKYSQAYRVLGADMQDVDIWTLKLTESQQIAKSGFEMFGDVLTSSLDSALSSQENFFDVFVKNIKRAIQSLLVQLAVMTLISAIMPASLGGIGKAAFSSKNIMGNLGKLMNIPAMADGGVVMGPQMALIGEAGPEAVIPLDQLKNFGGAQQVEVVGKISGTDIYLSNRNTGTNRQRSV
jgi:hypothetical protein